ncbi:MAG: prepilin-type N-terminal cleavage/methylation domain-containing protein [Planctomycetaceae bacterium]|jgi:prepilin-type N-terminal cleavage/methylation domain-containing protein|nr:prepilin-type N-terminal cleavage/methylation domain-containing protein [Planctomycetaceae bacterium]
MYFRFCHAFTLIEILLALMIMLILAGAGIPFLQGSLENQRLRSSAETLRGEWHHARIKAMEEGQILCFRCQLGGSDLIFDRVLDSHFTAGLSSRETSGRFDQTGELDPFEKGGFTGKSEDFILRDPSLASEETGSQLIRLSDSVFVADVIALVEERAAFYLGLTAPGETNTVEDNVSESEAVTNQEIRLGETTGSDGKLWSTPIFFYPDGTTSTAAVLLKNNRGHCIEVRLRGLTGIAKLTEINSTDNYSGELDVGREQEQIHE